MPEPVESSRGVRVTYGTTAVSARAGILPPHGGTTVRSNVLPPRRITGSAFLRKCAEA